MYAKNKGRDINTSSQYRNLPVKLNYQIKPTGGLYMTRILSENEMITATQKLKDYLHR